MQAITTAEARTIVGGANCPRTGPVGVVPKRHNANALVRDADGNIVGHQRFVSGNMTPEEAAVGGGFRGPTNATHTEARATTQMEIPQGGSMTITGQKVPCTHCRGYMNRAAYANDATIKYQWREDGKTKTWTTKK
ncbi:hypothetical protein [Roseateles amylovorans]|uniref:Deaminase n=1 Tax=Roseateles amylovorans TaxID=2978473 RepID=A0ABY6ATD4_9BURK|nr:hypothetical protein [Roseateles amylovorans]UXH76193.1 hypothetical protein N4261_14050 [Roseateles amylovorans]